METSLARASLYNFLAAAFGDPPTADLLAAAVEMLPDLPLAPLYKLHMAYTRLLVGPGKGYAPPYASVYLHPAANSKPQLWGPEAIKVEAIYRECGLEVAGSQPRLPDHLALELQFMQHLCAREANVIARGRADEAGAWRDLQQVFLRDHLWPWLPRFVGRLSEVKAHSFYLALANFMLEFIRSELEPHPTPAV
jgi:TorA maturation chaperone TorD